MLKRGREETSPGSPKMALTSNSDKGASFCLLASASPPVQWALFRELASQYTYNQRWNPGWQDISAEGQSALNPRTELRIVLSSSCKSGDLIALDTHGELEHLGWQGTWGLWRPCWGRDTESTEPTRCWDSPLTKRWWGLGGRFMDSKGVYTTYSDFNTRSSYLTLHTAQEISYTFELVT